MHHTQSKRNVHGAGLDEEAEDGVGAGGLGVQVRGAHVPLLLPLCNQGQGLMLVVIVVVMEDARQSPRLCLSFLIPAKVSSPTSAGE